MKNRFFRSACVLLLLAGGACAIESGTHSARPDVITPPRPLTIGRPALVGATVENRAQVEISVDVDARGRADLATLQVTGTSAAANRPIIEDWLRSLAFEPTRRNGAPVRGPFRLTAETTIAVGRS
jgi:hypothetical protein